MHYSKGLWVNPFEFLKTKQHNRTLSQQFVQCMFYVFKENLPDRNAITEKQIVNELESKLCNCLRTWETKSYQDNVC